MDLNQVSPLEVKIQKALGTHYQLRNYILRKHIDFKTNDDYLAFAHVNLSTLKQLFKYGCIDPQGTQNNSPTALEFLEFMTKYPMIECNGYVITEEREDQRITIEGLMYRGVVNRNLLSAFKKMCTTADEIVTDTHHLYSWWD